MTTDAGSETTKVFELSNTLRYVLSAPVLDSPKDLIGSLYLSTFR